MDEAPLQTEGAIMNTFHYPKFLEGFRKNFVPTIPFWSNPMLGDLGRHGTSEVYEELSKIFMKYRNVSWQNFTRDNRTQGVMEKSQWILKHNRNATMHKRVDDLILNYEEVHRALIDKFCETSGLLPDPSCTKKLKRTEKETWRNSNKKGPGYYNKQEEVKDFEMNTALDAICSTEEKDTTKTVESLQEEAVIQSEGTVVDANTDLSNNNVEVINVETGVITVEETRLQTENQSIGITLSRLNSKIDKETETFLSILESDCG